MNIDRSMFMCGGAVERRYLKLKNVSSCVRSQGFDVKELAKAEKLATEHQQLIIQKWHEHINQ